MEQRSQDKILQGSEAGLTSLRKAGFNLPACFPSPHPKSWSHQSQALLCIGQGSTGNCNRVPTFFYQLSTLQFRYCSRTLLKCGQLVGQLFSMLWWGHGLFPLCDLPAFTCGFQHGSQEPLVPAGWEQRDTQCRLWQSHDLTWGLYASILLTFH